MKIQITVILLITCMLSLVSSQTIYSGENYTFKTDLTEPIYYTVVGNSSNLDGMNISYDDGNITISTVVNFAPDSFTLIFSSEITKEVEKIIYRGGGHRTKYVDKIVNKTEIIYLPEYVNETKIVEVEKIVDNTTILETGYKLWHVFLAIIVGGVFIWYVMRDWGKEEEEEAPTIEEVVEKNNE